MAESTKNAMRKSYAEYLQIAELFRKKDPSAESLWQKFLIADNGWSLACGVIQNPSLIAE